MAINKNLGDRSSPLEIINFFAKFLQRTLSSFLGEILKGEKQGGGPLEERSSSSSSSSSSLPSRENCSLNGAGIRDGPRATNNEPPLLPLSPSFSYARLSISLSPSLSIHFLSSTTARAGFLSYRSRNDRVPFSLPPSRRFHATKEYSSSSSSSSCTMVFHRKRSLVSDMEIYFHTIGTSFSFSVPSPPSESRNGGGDANFYCSDSIVSCRYDISIREIFLSLSFVHSSNISATARNFSFPLPFFGTFHFCLII